LLRSIVLHRVIIVGITVLVCLTISFAKEESVLFMESILSDYGIPSEAIYEITLSATDVIGFIAGTSTHSGVVYAIAISKIEADKKEKDLLPGAAFNTAVSLSLEKYAKQEMEKIDLNSDTLRSVAMNYLRDYVLGVRIKRFLINDRGLYKDRAFGLVAYREDDLIEKPIIWLDLIPDFELSLYKKGYEALSDESMDTASSYFWGVYQLNYRYADDALAFLALIELNRSNREGAERYLKGIGVLNLTVNGLRICGRIYSALGKYDYANYFYGQLLRVVPDDIEAQQYFQKREEERGKLLEEALENIHIGSQDD